MQKPELLFESAKAYLQTKDEYGNSVYDMLSELFLYLKKTPPKEHYINLPDLLAQIQQDKFKYHETEIKRIFWSEKIANDPDHVKRAQKTKKLLQMEYPRQKLEDITGITDVLDDARYFELGGICLPDEELYKIALSMKQLAISRKLKKLRFFGKIYGIEKNYIICEAEHVPRSEKDQKRFPDPKPTTPEELALPPEEPGVGTNKFSYFVCNNAGDPWIQLPDVSPQQINVARVIKKYFTGNLNHPIKSYPEFPGVEANYLRAQISRISAATVLAPAGMFKEYEQEEGEEPEDAPAEKKPKPDVVTNPEYQALNPATMTDLKQWVHLYPIIRPIGRCTKYKPPKPKPKEGEEEEEEEEEQKEEEEEEESKEQVVPLLTPVDSDTILMSREIKKKKPPKKETEGEEGEKEEEEEEPPKEEEEEEEEGDDKAKAELRVPAWSVRIYNDLNKQYAVAIIRSHRWPGAYSFTCEQGKKFGNIYIGYGLKDTGGAFTPLIPPPVQKESPDLVEQNDPKDIDEKKILGLIEEEEGESGDEEEGESDEDDEEDKE